VLDLDSRNSTLSLAASCPPCCPWSPQSGQHLLHFAKPENRPSDFPSYTAVVLAFLPSPDISPSRSCSEIFEVFGASARHRRGTDASPRVVHVYGLALPTRMFTPERCIASLNHSSPPAFPPTYAFVTLQVVWSSLRLSNVSSKSQSVLSRTLLLTSTGDSIAALDSFPKRRIHCHSPTAPPHNTLYPNPRADSDYQCESG